MEPSVKQQQQLAVLNEAEGEPSDVRMENGEDKDREREPAMEVTAESVEREKLLLQDGSGMSTKEPVTTPAEVAATLEASAEGERLLPQGGAAMLTKEAGTAPADMAATPHVLIRDGPSAEKSEETRKPLESVSEPCRRPLLGVQEQKCKSGSLSDKKGVAIPKGKPKSGRIWKDQNKKRFSGMVKDRPLHTSWDKKMAARREKSLMKDFAQRLKDEKRKAKEEKKQRREENLKRRLENERKAEVVQVITNLAKLKRAKKKQLRRIEKRDTLALAQRGTGLHKKAERLAQFLKKKKEGTKANENTN